MFSVYISSKNNFLHNIYISQISKLFVNYLFIKIWWNSLKYPILLKDIKLLISDTIYIELSNFIFQLANKLLNCYKR